MGKKKNKKKSATARLASLAAARVASQEGERDASGDEGSVGPASAWGEAEADSGRPAPPAVAELEVRLPPPTDSSPGTLASTSAPVVELHPSDAAYLDVLEGEQLLFLPLSASGVYDPPLAAVGKAVIVQPGRPPHLSPSGKRSRKPPPRAGEARIQPPTLLRRLFPGAMAEAEVAAAASPSPPTPAPSALARPGSSSTPSPSGSKFSFARGGGGDAVISTPSPAPAASLPPSSSRAAASARRGMVALIPMYQLSDLPPRMRRALLGRADRISVSSGGMTADELARSDKLLAGLALHCCDGSHVQRGDVLNVPFGGRTTRLEVEAIAGRRPREDEEAAVDGDDVDMDEWYGAEPLPEVLQDLFDVLSEMGDEERLLFQIWNGTEVKFPTEEPKPEQGEIGGDEESILRISRRMDQMTLSGVDASKKLVAGLDGPIEDIKSVLVPSLLHPEMFTSQAGSMRPPRGVLIHGPSGVGKSRLASQVGKVLLAGNDPGAETKTGDDGKSRRRIAVEVVSCSNIQSMSSIVGRAERVLGRTFDLADRRASEGTSTLLIMDDIHQICPRRGFIGGGGGGGGDMLASTLLALLDGIGRGSTVQKGENSQGLGTVMILATTSDPSSLDPALRRPGRLDSEVEVPIPDDAARSEILKFLLERLACGTGESVVATPELSDVELLSVARLAKGFTGADCKLAIKEAVRSAVLKDMGEGGARDASISTIRVSLDELNHAIRLTKPSTIRAVSVEVPKVPWSSIGGMDEVKKLLREAIELPITHSHMFESLGVQPPRGVLLYGPPGCSKTLMARALATEGNMNFLAVKGPELLSKWLGESERALASLFRRARMASPCVIFFDEIDSIASTRTGGGGSGERLLSQLLTELDGVASPSSGVGGSKTDVRKERVVVVGATNRPDLLDPALTRPGRIDRKIYVGLPDEASRQGILRISLQEKACDDDIDVSSAKRPFTISTSSYIYTIQTT